MTAKRMSLVESLKRDQDEIDPVVERNFLKYGTAAPPLATVPVSPPEPLLLPPAQPWASSPTESASPAAMGAEARPAKPPKPSRVSPVGLIPVTVRLRPEIAGALKRASLERQLSGEDFYTQQEIVEQALEPWLRKQGYLE
jgi:hypothetical protein